MGGDDVGRYLSLSPAILQGQHEPRIGSRVGSREGARPSQGADLGGANYSLGDNEWLAKDDNVGRREILRHVPPI